MAGAMNKVDDMPLEALLIFDLDGTRFALDATRVRETVWLPELTPVEEAPPWIVGLFDLRGRIVPVTDLRLRFGHPPRPYHIADQVLLLETEQRIMGLIVSEVIEISEIPGDAIQPPPQFDAGVSKSAHLVAGEARVGDDLVILLDAAAMAHLFEAAEIKEPGVPLASLGYFCPEATPEMRALFRARALALQASVDADDKEPLGLAVVELGGEYFGFELTAIKEFCNIVELCPIPCCPPHILGVMKLRGDLLTVIDPRAALNLSTDEPAGSKAVVGFLGDVAVGLAVDDVHDAVYLGNGDLQEPPSAMRDSFGVRILGTAFYTGSVMILLDLAALLAREAWAVNENVQQKLTNGNQ